jgi:hypothetical protein
MNKQQNEKTSEVVEEVKQKLQKYQAVLGIEEVFNTNSPYQLRFNVIVKSLTSYQMKNLEAATRIEILSIEPIMINKREMGLEVLVEVDKNDLTRWID